MFGNSAQRLHKDLSWIFAEVGGEEVEGIRWLSDSFIKFINKHLTFRENYKK